jgi:hypothetical protein
VLVVVVVVAVVVVAIVVLALAASRRRPSRDDGVADFRRHLGALSPEARRQVIDRVRKAEDGADDGEGGS